MDAGALTPTRILGRYALFSEIAAGGMATVHLGRFLGANGFTRPVAIKCLHPQFAKDPDFVAMFLDEARLAARIQHPNVVSTLDVIATDDGLFLVMEYVQGESLSRLVRAASQQEKRLPPEVAAAIVVGTLHGLHAAHEAMGPNGEPLQIVHRDVSPQNIIVGKDGAARVLDFGVAKAANRATQTRDGVVKGKLPYMAPEQFAGEATCVTDVYAAAVVLWEALVGRRLFRGENEAQTLKLVLEGVTAPPSKHVPGLPPAFDAIVLKGLARDPAQRFQTAREMARALEKSVFVATPSDVGEFVATLAGPSLAERASKLRQIESSSITIEGDSAPRPSSPMQTTNAPVAAMSSQASGVVAEMGTQLATISDGVAGETVNAVRSRRALGVVVAAALVLATIMVFVALRTRGRSDGETAASPRSPPPPVSSLTAPPSSARPEGAVLPVDPSSAPAPATATSAEEPPHRPRAQAPVRPINPHAAASARAPAKASANCNPPYTIDAEGFRHYKRECE